MHLINLLSTGKLHVFSDRLTCDRFEHAEVHSDVSSARVFPSVPTVCVPRQGFGGFRPQVHADVLTCTRVLFIARRWMTVLVFGASPTCNARGT